MWGPECPAAQGDHPARRCAAPQEPHVWRLREPRLQAPVILHLASPAEPDSCPARLCRLLLHGLRRQGEVLLCWLRAGDVAAGGRPDTGAREVVPGLLLCQDEGGHGHH